MTRRPCITDGDQRGKRDNCPMVAGSLRAPSQTLTYREEEGFPTLSLSGQRASQPTQ